MTVAIIVGIFLMMDLIVVTTLLRACVMPLRELGKQFAAREPGAGAVRKNFQSFRFGIMNAGWSVHVAVDETHLHLWPTWIMRVCGMPALSIPWSAVKMVKRGRRNSKVVLAGDRERLDVLGPNWCLELAGG